MGSSARRLAALALLPLGAPACLTGHLLDAARRRERPIAFHEACVDGSRLLLAYTALVTDDAGQPLARAERRVAIALADLRRGGVPVEAFPVERLADDAPLGGRRLALHVDPIGTREAPAGLLIEKGPGGRHVRLVLREDGGAECPPFHASALGRARTAPWAYPVLPLVLAVDAVTNPVLLFFAPAVIAVGD